MSDSGIPGKRAFDQTIEEAKSAIREAIEAFMEECERMGTLEDVLEVNCKHQKCSLKRRSAGLMMSMG